jgi:hypothetical protein
MFFRITSSTPDKDLLIYRIRRQSKLKLTLYRLGPTELLLSRYLQEHYGVSLLEACAKILANATFNFNLDHDIIVTISDPELNMISKIITYGTGTVKGSRILKESLTLT